MEYFAILKRAAKITWQAKYLWIFGLFAGVGSGSFNFNSSGNWQSNDLGSNGGQAMTGAKNFLTDNLIWVAVAILALLLIGLVFFVLSVIARGGLIHCVNRIETGQPTGFKDGLRAGAKKFLPVLGTALIAGLVILAAVVILGVPVGLLFYFQMTLRAILLLIFALAIFIPLAVVISMVGIWSWQYIVIEDKKVIESWKLGFDLFRHNLGANLLMWLLLMVVGLVAGIAFIIVIFIIAIPFLLLGFIAYAIVQWAGVAVVVAMGIMFLLLLSLFYGAVLSTFQSATWTLTFRELVKSDK
ncbi:MAG: hypothetical protein HQ530_05570 [Parcubacteria group bacterium]|nr:hypothetical protein [Parcubacteria group bacterium]